MISVDPTWINPMVYWLNMDIMASFSTLIIYLWNGAHLSINEESKITIQALINKAVSETQIHDLSGSRDKIVELIYDPSGSLDKMLDWIYDPRGSLGKILSWIYDLSGSLDKILGWIYDPSGSLGKILGRIYDPSGSLATCHTIALWSRMISRQKH